MLYNISVYFFCVILCVLIYIRRTFTSVKRTINQVSTIDQVPTFISTHMFSYFVMMLSL